MITITSTHDVMWLARNDKDSLRISKGKRHNKDHMGSDTLTYNVLSEGSIGHLAFTGNSWAQIG